MKTLVFVLSVVAFFSGGKACRADAWRRADLYFIDWETETRASLSPERVRQLADYKRTFRRNVPDIVRALANDRFKPARDKSPEDARLVIDLFTDKGERITYYASRFDLCTADNASKHPIDAEFRRRFARLAK